MNDQPEIPQARVRRSRGLALVWLVPIAALAIVAWLGARTLWERGSLITITFTTAEGLQAGQTQVRHKNVEVGVVEHVLLSKDLNHVVVTVRLHRSVDDVVTDSAKFWVVRPRLTGAGISGLNTIVSGSYIEMEPGKAGQAQDHFVGLEDPPIEPTGEPGRNFTLHADKLGSLSQGAPLYYRGIPAGEVLGYALADQGEQVSVYIFVKSPYDKMVHPQTRFWNASGISITAGAEGLRASTESLQALVAGGVAFETAPEAMVAPPSPEGAIFPIYDNESAAHAEPLGQKVLFTANFPGPVHGLAAGNPVELMGIVVGQVTDVHLEYDAKLAKLSTPVTFEIEPERVSVSHGVVPKDGNFEPVVDTAMGQLVAQGLRARLATGNLLTGQRLVSLEFDAAAPPAAMKLGGEHPEVPAVDSGDIESATRAATALMTKLSSIADDLKRFTGSSEMTLSVQSLQRTLANVEHLTATANTDLPPLIASLRETADAATKTLDTVTHEVGGGTSRNSDLQGMLHELGEAARSVRSLADYLDQHPEALIRGRSPGGQ